MFQDLPPIPRRTFLAYGLAAGWMASRAFAESPASGNSPAMPVNALSPLKQRLLSGQSATLLIISDSTGYQEVSATRRFIRWLAAQFSSHRVTELYWAEW